MPLSASTRVLPLVFLSLVLACGGGDAANNTGGTGGTSSPDGGIPDGGGMPDGGTPDGGAGGAMGDGGMQDGAPVIEQFGATPISLPDGGGTATLTWQVSGADSLSVAPNVGIVTGNSVDVAVTETTTFTLTATNAMGSTTRSTSVLIVSDGPPPFPRAGVPTSIGAISDALEAGTITAIDALRYKLFALFGDPRLPAEFSAQGRIHGTPIMKELAQQFGALPANVQDELRPFTIPPGDAGSWYLGTRARRAKGPANPDMIEVVDGAIQIEWHDDLALAESILVTGTLAAALEGAYPKLIALMNRAPKSYTAGAPFRISVVINESNSDYGWMTRNPADDTRSFLTVNLSETFPNVKLFLATVLHEMMHSIQTTYSPVKRNGPEVDWLEESTATWVEHFSFPDFNTEQEYASELLDKPGPALDTIEAGGSREYAGYLFHLFVQQELGAETIRTMFEQTESLEPFAAINGAFGGQLSELWPKFAAYNWNEEPFDFYKRWDDVSEAVADNDEPVVVKVSSQQDFELIDLEVEGVQGVERLSAQYFHYDLTDSSVRTIVVANGYSHQLSMGTSMLTTGDETLIAKTLTPEQKKGRNVTALVKADGEWMADPVDITDVAFVTFCQDYAEERVEELVLIFNNTLWDERTVLFDRGTEKPQLFVSNMACGDWAGNGTATSTTDRPGLMETETAMFNNLRFTRDRLTREALLAGAGQSRFPGDIVPADTTFNSLGRYRLDTVDVTWSVVGQRTRSNETCTTNSMGSFVPGGGILGGATSFELKPSLTAATASELSIYRSFFITMIAMAPGTPVIENCTMSGTNMTGFITGITGGRRNLPTNQSPLVVSNDGNRINETWSVDDEAFELDLTGVSDP